MYKYIKFTKVETSNTVLEFRGGDDIVKVNSFTGVDVVSVEADNEADIDTLVSSQSGDINCTEIEQDEFKTLVKDSAQIKRIRAVVKEKISQRYDIADEIAIAKLATDDTKRVDYDDYVIYCVAIGYGLKSEIGY